MVYRKLRNVLDHHKASLGSLIREPNNVDNLSQLPPYCLALAALDELEGARAPCLIKDSLEKTDLETVSDTSGIRIRVDHMVDQSCLLRSNCCRPKLLTRKEIDCGSRLTAGTSVQRGHPTRTNSSGKLGSTH